MEKHCYSLRHHLGFYQVTVIVMIFMTASCDACGGGRQRTPPPKSKPATTPRSSQTLNTSTNTQIPLKTTRPPVSQHEGYCFSITYENVTNKSIKTSLDEYASSGNLSQLFNDANYTKVFLKWLKPSDTSGCFKVYQIGIKRTDTKETSKSYKYNIVKLNETAASNYCAEEMRNCSALSNATGGSSKDTKETPTEGTNKEGTAAAGKSGGDGATTIIVISVVVVSLLLVIVVIFTVWFRRRSAKKLESESKTEDSSNRLAGPINGDVYTIVNPAVEKKKNNKSKKSDASELVYTEMSHFKSEGKPGNEEPEAEKTEYADITHVLKAGNDTTYENAALHTSDESYSNVRELKSKDL